MESFQTPEKTRIRNSANSLIYKYESIIIPFIISAALILVFIQVRHFNFLLWDDDLHIAENKWMNPVTRQSFIHFWKNPFDIPVTFSFWALEKLSIQKLAQFPDGSQSLAGSFHMINFLIHIANTLLVYCLILMFIRHRWIAGAGALLFGLHPVQVEAVAWISSLKDLLSAFFSLMSIILFFLAKNSSAASQRHFFVRIAAYAGSIFFFWLALMSKPTTAVVPFLIFLISYFIYKTSMKEMLKSIIPFLILAIPYALAAKISQPDYSIKNIVPIYFRPLISLDAIGFYIHKLFLPFSLHVDYGRTPAHILEKGIRALFWPLTALSLSYIAALLAKAKRRLLFSFLFFVIAVIPVLGLLPFGFQDFSTVADRYLYLAMIGLCASFSLVLHDLKKRNSIVALFTISLIIFCAVKSHMQTSYWKDTKTLFSHTLNENPSSVLACQMLGLVASASNDTAAAFGFFKKGLAMRPDNAGTLNYLAEEFEKSNYLDSAAIYYSAAANAEPGNPDVLNNLGVVMGKMGKSNDARGLFNKAIALRPDFAVAKVNLAYEYQKAALYDSAKTCYLLALSSQKTNPKISKNLSLVFSVLGDTAQAAKYARLSNENAVDSIQDTTVLHKRADSLNSRGVALVLQNKKQEAIPLFREALELCPAHAEANTNYRKALIDEEQFKTAKQYFLAAVRRLPNDPAINMNLGLLFAHENSTDTGLAYIKKALLYDTANVHLLNEIGVIYAQKADYCSAVNFFGKAVRLDSGYAAARNNFQRARKLCPEKQ